MTMCHTVIDTNDNVCVRRDVCIHAWRVKNEHASLFNDFIQRRIRLHDRGFLGEQGHGHVRNVCGVVVWHGGAFSSRFNGMFGFRGHDGQGRIDVKCIGEPLVAVVVNAMSEDAARDPGKVKVACVCGKDRVFEFGVCVCDDGVYQVLRELGCVLLFWIGDVIEDIEML